MTAKQKKAYKSKMLRYWKDRDVNRLLDFKEFSQSTLDAAVPNVLYHGDGWLARAAIDVEVADILIKRKSEDGHGS